ncbi:methyltransferase domain-containing protein [bacterium]|nr:methyltransferase domain-containing protein [bacterium]
MSELAPTIRFSNRVDDYRRFRPTYPAAVIDLLKSRVAPRPDAQVADVGSGTGIFARLLLESGYRVVAIEPNRDMAAVATSELASFPGFRLLHAPAEELPLDTASVDLITVAQAFHWFDPERVRVEFLRVLKPGGLVALVWNERRRESEFDCTFDDLLHRKGTDYTAVNPRVTGRAKMDLFWHNEDRDFYVFPNSQSLDREAFHGRVASASYTPAPGSPEFPAFHAEVDRLFDRFQQDGFVEIRYDCEVYIGRPRP